MRVGGAMAQIGVSSDRQLTRSLFEDVYSGWPGRNVYLTQDIGLIRIDDLTNWTAQVFGVGTIGEIADLAIDNLSLRLIDQPVRAYGCASGLMKGSIKALFYRYRSLGGFEYVSDFLIGARDEKIDFQTHPGDSGTLWLLEVDKDLRPIAVQWGGSLFSGDQGMPAVSCALATSLSAVCDRLDVDIIRDWNLGSFEYWGEMGHYTIGALACTVGFPGLPGLALLLKQNLDRIGFPPNILKQKEKVLIGTAHYSFVPLADVADDVWRITRSSTDPNNHFADMDQPAASGPYRGKTLLDLCTDPANVDPQVWVDFYNGTPGTNPGSLPFRVWQIYDWMVQYLKQKDIPHFLASAGCLAHYVGDACQPLHISRLHHGYPPLHKGSFQYNVHSVYETQMLNDHASDLVDGVVQDLHGETVTGSFSTGHCAAVRVIQLMRDTVQKLPPQDIVDTYNAAKTKTPAENALWTRYGTKTMSLMADGCVCLADIWASAWKEGQGETIAHSELGPVDETTLASYYKDSAFLPSLSLKQMVGILHSDGTECTPSSGSSGGSSGGASNASGSHPAKKTTKKKSAKKKSKKH
jgi:hypothetical protein